MYGEKIKILRKKAGLSQAELADMVGVSRPNISFWENAEFPPLDAINRLCKVLNIEIWEFFIDNQILSKQFDIPHEFIELIHDMRTLDNSAKADLLEIFTVILHKFIKAESLPYRYPINSDKRLYDSEKQEINSKETDFSKMSDKEMADWLENWRFHI